MQNDPNDQLEESELVEEERIKTALSDLFTALSVCAVISAIYLLIRTLKVDYRFGVIAADTPFVIAKVLGGTIGILLIPFLLSLIFKKKARVFIIAWLIFMALNIAVFVHDLNEMI